MVRKVLVASLSAALLGEGCYSVTQESSRTGPSSAVAIALGGTWTTAQSFSGVAPGGGISQTCTSFSWRVTEFSGTSGSGVFTAKCLGALNVTGSAQGIVSGTSVNWSANATATGPGAPNGCAVSLAGMSQLDGGEIRIPYTGTTCLGSVAGTEVLGKDPR
jgi:hypothetical protein